jgi:hypothetical protein
VDLDARSRSLPAPGPERRGDRAQPAASSSGLPRSSGSRAIARSQSAASPAGASGARRSIGVGRAALDELDRLLGVLVAAPRRIGAAAREQPVEHRAHGVHIAREADVPSACSGDM